MSEQLQLRRGAASQIAAFTGAQGELVVDTTNNRAVVNDGATAGGWPAAKLAEVITNARTAVADAAYAAQPTDRLIAYSSLSGARVVRLCAAAAYPTGTRLTVVDESGACSAAKTITINRAGADTIGGATSAVLSSAYGYLALESDGVGKWTTVDQATSNLGAVGVGTAADPNNPLSVYGASALFNGVSFSFTINKAAAADTASIIFEDGFSGRAQIGLNGADDFSFKVAPDGATWATALTIAAATGAATFGGALLSTSAAGVGYATGAGGTVTQATSKSTAVTLNAAVGRVTMNAASLAAGAIVSFTLNDSSIAANDLLVLNHAAGGSAGAYSLNAQCAAGSATINVRNATSGALAEEIVIAFAVIKGAAS
ncbi:MAG: hypothetical protein ABSF67_03775 [Roseiarcus sp.]|jgi:hypothetical protein